MLWHESLSWRVTLLPFHEQQALFGQIDLERSALSPANLPAARVMLLEHQCPSTPGYPRRVSDLGGEGLPLRANVNVAARDYTAITQVFNTPSGIPTGYGCWTGPAERDYWSDWWTDPSTLRHVGDGLSNTALLLENVGEPNHYGRDQKEEVHPDWWPGAGAWIGGEWATVNIALGVNERNFTNLYSFHPGGAQMALCDGSVHFISEAISVATFVALLTRDGGEVINAKDWQ
jgi:prepilin-type processing-associated H-X9-DG protein